MHSFFRRLISLTVKEFRQLVRNSANLLLGVGLPIILILIFGYGISFEISHVNFGIVDKSRDDLSGEISRRFHGSEYFNPRYFYSEDEAFQALKDQQIEGFISFPGDFFQSYQNGDGRIGLVIDSKDPNRAQNISSYVSSLVEKGLSFWASEHQGGTVTFGTIGVNLRMWYNEASISTWYIIPGLIVLIVTLIGTFLTALVMAREYEQGTIDVLFVSPARPLEIILGKIIPYFCVAVAGLFLCMLSAWLLFQVPMRGSMILIVLFSVIYLIITLAIGLMISAVTKNQFVASQLSIITSFLPCIMLSGFVFDLRNVPEAVDIIGHILPSTYYLESIKCLYLAGNYSPLLIKNGLILATYCVVLVLITLAKTKKRIG